MKECCCETMSMHVNNPPDGGFGRHVRIVITKEGLYYTDFSEGEYGDIELFFCPFCGTKLHP